jgi:hypothetical protein
VLGDVGTVAEFDAEVGLSAVAGCPDSNSARSSVAEDAAFTAASAATSLAATTRGSSSTAAAIDSTDTELTD